MGTPIRAALLREAGGAFELRDCELEAPLPHELRVEMRACGICHTDLTTRSGGLPVPMPIVLGHEGVGVVRQCGAAVQGVQVGDQVLLSFGYCGQCASCPQTGP